MGITTLLLIKLLGRILIGIIQLVKNLMILNALCNPNSYRFSCIANKVTE